MKPPAPSESQFARVPDAEPVHVVIREATVEKSPFKDEKTGKDKLRVKVVMEAVDPELQSARVWAFPGFSLHEKSGLRKIALAANPDLDLDTFDTDDLVGQQLVIIGERKDENDDYIKPTIFKTLSRSKWVSEEATAPKAKASKAAPVVEEDGDLEDF